MAQKLFKPDYKHGLVNLSNSVLIHFGLKPKHPGLPELDKAFSEKDYKNVILLVMDGMGCDMLRHNLEKESFLRKYIKTGISSVYPPTTTAATTSIYSGLCPKEHGWAGWQCYFKEYGKNIELFRNLDFYTQQPAGTDVGKEFLDYKKLYEQIREAGKYKAYGVAMPWGDFNVGSFDDICRRITDLSAEPGKKFILSYWKQPDGIMHKTGCYSPETKKAIRELNEKIENLANSLKDSLLIITADHGQIDIEHNVMLNEICEICDCLRLPPAIEPRTVGFYIKPEKKTDFEQAFAKLFKDEFILLPAEEFLERGYMGEGKEHPKLREFLGDYVALAVGTTILQYDLPNGEKSPVFLGHHAGLTAKEMEVPLIIFAS